MGPKIPTFLYHDFSHLYYISIYSRKKEMTIIRHFFTENDCNYLFLVSTTTGRWLLISS